MPETDGQRKSFRSDIEEGRPLVFKMADEKGTHQNGLLLEESYGGFSCMIVGHIKPEMNQILEWLESDAWLTSVKVVRVDELKLRVYFVAVEIET